MEKLKEVQITPVLSEEAVAAVTKQMEDLKLKLGQQMTVPLKITPTAEQVAIGDPAASKPVTYPVPAATTQSPTTPVVVQQPNSATPSTQQAASKLKYKSGVTSYTQDQLNVPVKPVLEEDYYDKIVREVAARGKVPVTVEPQVSPDALGKVDVPVQTAMDSASVSATQSQVATLAAQLRQSLVIPVSVVPPAGGAPAPATPDLPSFAAGDMVRGPGTGTSDSILSWLSNGEFVMRAASVQHYGPEFLRMINERRLPRFATGGEVSTRSLPSIPAPSQSLLRQIDPPAPEPFASVALTVGGNTYNVNAPRNELDRMLRDQRIKFGGTT